MTSKAESLAEAIMKMAEEDKGLVKSKLVEMIEANAFESRFAKEELYRREFLPDPMRRYVDPPLVKPHRQAK